MDVVVSKYTNFNEKINKLDKKTQKEEKIEPKLCCY